MSLQSVVVDVGKDGGLSAPRRWRNGAEILMLLDGQRCRDGFCCYAIVWRLEEAPLFFASCVLCLIMVRGLSELRQS